MARRGDDIPLADLLQKARRDRDRMLTGRGAPIRFRPCEALGVAELDAVIGWLERIPLTEWSEEYLEDPVRPRGAL